MRSRNKEFKREYIPVIITGIILVLLIAALVFMIFYKGNLDLEEVPVDTGNKAEEINVEIDKDKCSSDLIKTLTNESSKIEMNYEENYMQSEVTDEEDSGENYYTYDPVWTVKFDNMTDNFYIKVTNDKTDDVITLTKDTITDGKWQFDTQINNEVVTYTISIISNVDGCTEQTFKKFELKALISNLWSSSAKCSVYPDFKYCQRWTDEDVLTYSEFKSELKKYIKENNLEDINPYGTFIVPTTTTETGETETDSEVNTTTTTTTTKVTESTSTEKDKKNNMIIYIAAAIAIIVVVGVVTVLLLKKKRSK
jgi:succinate dehydrogenase hydrophobic anchor subunit